MSQFLPWVFRALLQYGKQALCLLLVDHNNFFPTFHYLPTDTDDDDDESTSRLFTPTFIFLSLSCV